MDPDVQNDPNGNIADNTPDNRFTFYVFNPKLTTESRDEDEQQDVRILYYSPSFTSREEIRSQVSLTQGLIDFTQQFDIIEGGKPLHSMKTKMYSFSLQEVEPDIWFTLIAKHPVISVSQTF